jgi:hypothetical protein
MRKRTKKGRDHYDVCLHKALTDLEKALAVLLDATKLAVVRAFDAGRASVPREGRRASPGVTVDVCDQYKDDEQDGEGQDDGE